MKLPCPHCNQALNLPERLAGKTTKCPACQQSVTVPALAEGAPTGEGGAPLPTMAQADAMSLGALMERKDAGREAPKLSVCPKCQAKWKEGAFVCAKCNYSALLGRRLPTSKKPLINLNFDIQKVFLWLFIAALMYGGYYLYHHGADIKRKGDKLFDEAARGTPSPEDNTQVKRNR